jgi:hypothetical protein
VDNPRADISALVASVEPLSSEAVDALFHEIGSGLIRHDKEATAQAVPPDVLPLRDAGGWGTVLLVPSDHDVTKRPRRHQVLGDAA